MNKLSIGFIGNFEPPYSTENDRLWSFLMLGHNVTTFQENKTTIDDLRYKANDLDLLIYSHTHGWEIPDLYMMFNYCKVQGIPTASVHLDRWAWLERESDIGNEATWFTEYQFMADFSPEAVSLYNKHNLNAYYLKPGVVARDCYIAAPDPVKFPHPIVFVGSKGYHKEYPYRGKLIEWLHKTYGNKFGHYGDDLPGQRGHNLNVLYSTAKVCIGDSCFAPRPNYVSDRYYETRGRGGFLLHPKTEGVDSKGVWFYKHDDWDELKRTIDGALKNDWAREENRKKGFEWVKNNETYTHRAKEMLEIIFG